MKNFLYPLMLSALLLSGCTQKSAMLIKPEWTNVEVGPYTVTKINDQIFHVQDFNTANPAGEDFDEVGNKTHFNNCSDLYLLVGSEKALLVDLSNYITWNDSAISSLRSLVSERIGDRPLTITFTHNHGDHVGMLPAYKEDKMVHFALSTKDFSDRLEMFPDSQYTLIDEGYLFDLGDIKVNTIEVPGHTTGSLVFHVQDQNILLTGDAIGSGHGVWIFNAEGYSNYKEAVPHLMSYVLDGANGIDTTALRIYGGHYWQRDWMNGQPHGTNPMLPVLNANQELGMTYLRDMERLVNDMINGTVNTEPSNLNFRNLDTYFIHQSAIMVWNKDEHQATLK